MATATVLQLDTEQQTTDHIYIGINDHQRIEIYQLITSTKLIISIKCKFIIAF